MSAVPAGIWSRRTFLKSGGAMIIGATLPAAAWAQGSGAAAMPGTVGSAIDKALGKTLDAAEVDGFFAVHADGSVTLFCGKVDLGTGLRAAIPQMAAEELGIDFARITLIEGDTALTPDQGATAGSTGIMRGGVQIRQAAATAREALIRIAAERLGRPASELEAVNGEVRPKGGGAGINFGALIGDKRFGVKLDPKAPLRDPGAYTLVGKPQARPDVPAKVTGRHVYVHDFTLPGMLHGRTMRPASVGATLLAVDESSLRGIRAQVVRVNNFLGVVAEDEWDAVRAARALKVTWSKSETLMGHGAVRERMRAGPFEADESLIKTGDARAVLSAAGKKFTASYYWPVQSHASMGPSCAVADMRDGKLTVWSASQATHRLRVTLARLLAVPPAGVRVVYLDGSGCYGMNGHDDAAADAALMSRVVGKPVRVQWSREDEHGWDPKGPPQLLEMEGALTAEGRIAAWRTEMWLPKATASLPNVPLLGPQDAGISQPMGISTGLITQNGNPPYAVPNVDVVVHWLKDAPLRPSNIRAPGKVANCFAVESFTDELAAAAGRDPVEFRLEGLSDPRGVEVLKRTVALLGWQPRPSPVRSGNIGRGMAYMHYKGNETYVAVAMEVRVNRLSGEIQVRRLACAHDCGLVINADSLRSQIEGSLLQTLSRTLHEEVKFDRARVTSTDWASYPILTFPEVPEVLIDVIDRPKEPPLGAGEAAATPVPAALANAIFDACGVRLRTVPFTRERVKAALIQHRNKGGKA